MEDKKCIVAIVERGKADHIVDEAKKAGAQGATIFYARGTGKQEALKFFGLQIEQAKEVILILSTVSKFKPIYRSIIETGHLDKPGTGIVFTVPVKNLAGLHHRETIEEIIDEE